MTAAACLPRSRENLIAAVEEVNPLKPEFLPHDVTGDGKAETFCNVFVRLVLAFLGIAIPPMLANELFDWFAGPVARADGWTNVKSMAEAERLVERGVPVVAVMKAGATPCEACAGKGCSACGGKGEIYHHGHIALGVPQPVPPSKVLGLRIAQAGAQNFKNGPFTAGFGRRTVRLFTHP